MHLINCKVHVVVNAKQHADGVNYVILGLSAMGQYAISKLTIGGLTDYPD